jgi:hypothetical protein
MSNIPKMGQLPTWPSPMLVSLLGKQYSETQSARSEAWSQKLVLVLAFLSYRKDLF